MLATTKTAMKAASTAKTVRPATTSSRLTRVFGRFRVAAFRAGQHPKVGLAERVAHLAGDRLGVGARLG